MSAGNNNLVRSRANTTIYTFNRVQIKKGTNLTPYELWFGYTPSVKYFKIFGSKIYILKVDRKGKLDAKGEEGILFGYSTRSKAYKCLNTNTEKLWKVLLSRLMNTLN